MVQLCSRLLHADSGEHGRSEAVRGCIRLRDDFFGSQLPPTAFPPLRPGFFGSQLPPTAFPPLRPDFFGSQALSCPCIRNNKGPTPKRNRVKGISPFISIILYLRIYSRSIRTSSFTSTHLFQIHPLRIFHISLSIPDPSALDHSLRSIYSRSIRLRSFTSTERTVAFLHRRLSHM